MCVVHNYTAVHVKKNESFYDIFFIEIYSIQEIFV